MPFYLETIAFATGGPMLTIGNAKHSLTLGADAFYGRTFEIFESEGFAFAPRIGTSLSINRHIKFNADFYSLHTTSSHGDAFVLLYGLRFFGQNSKIYGDVSMIKPIIPSEFDSTDPALLLGFPLLTLGLTF